MAPSKERILENLEKDLSDCVNRNSYLWSVGNLKNMEF